MAPARPLAATSLIANSGAYWTSLYHVPQNHYCQLTVCECMTYILQETGLAKRLLRNVPFTLKQDVDTQSGQLFFLFLIKAFLLEVLIVAHLVNKLLAFHDSAGCTSRVNVPDPQPALSVRTLTLYPLASSFDAILPSVPPFFKYAVVPCSFPVLHKHLICVCVLQIQLNSSSLI